MITKVQRKALEHWRLYRQQHPPSLWFLVRLSWPALLIPLVFIMAGAAYFFFGDHVDMACAALGMAAGVALRDIGVFRRFLQVWPIMSSVLDWKRIDELLDEPGGYRRTQQSRG